MTKLVFLLASICLLCSALPALGGEIHEAIEAGDVARVKKEAA